eukprot:8318911-Pyramimonas_sp.AAC.1
MPVGADGGQANEQRLLGRFASNGMFWIWFWKVSSFNWRGLMGALRAEDGGRPVRDYTESRGAVPVEVQRCRN